MATPSPRLRPKSQIINVSKTSMSDFNKKRPKYIWTLKIFTSLDSTVFKSLNSCMKHTKYIRALYSNDPTQKLAHIMTPNLKTLKSVYVARDDDTKTQFKPLQKINKKLPNLKYYRCALYSKNMPILRSLRSVETFELYTKDRTLTKMKLQDLGFYIRHIVGMKRVCVKMLQTSLVDFLELTKQVPQTKEFHLNLLEFNIPKNFKELNLLPLSKITSLHATSVSKFFVEFFTENILLFEDLQKLNLSANDPTILNLSAFTNYTIFSNFAVLEKLKFLNLHFRFPSSAPANIQEFFDSMRLPLNLERLSLSLNKFALGTKGYEVEKFANMLRQIQDLKSLRGLTLKIDLESPDTKVIDELFFLLPKNLPALRSFYLDLFYQDMVAINVKNIFTWVSTHKYLNYLHLNMPAIFYAGFDDPEVQNYNFSNLTILNIVSTNRNYFSQDNFSDFMRFIGSLHQLRSLHFNCWGSSCSTIEVDSIVKYLTNFKYLRDLTISMDMKNIDIEEVLKFQEILRSSSSLSYFFLFIRKSGYEMSEEILANAKIHFLADKVRLKNSLCISVNQKVLV